MRDNKLVCAGARRQHNLKNINVEIHRKYADGDHGAYVFPAIRRLAFCTHYAERGQRTYVEIAAAVRQGNFLTRGTAGSGVIEGPARPLFAIPSRRPPRGSAAVHGGERSRQILRYVRRGVLIAASWLPPLPELREADHAPIERTDCCRTNLHGENCAKADEPGSWNLAADLLPEGRAAVPERA